MSQNQQHITKQNTIYYDAIAADYDAILNDSSKTELVRTKMGQKLIELVPNGIVLDFGGGTGEDLKWLLKYNYRVIFCEPSNGMRSIAISKAKTDFPNAQITFLENDQTNFETWNIKLPFQEKANAVIANFAVLNCIANLEQFFKHLALVTASNAQVFLMVLDFELKNKIASNPLKAFQSLIMKKTMTIEVEFNGQQQLVYLHSVKSIQKATTGYFDFKDCESLKAEGFSLIHLSKK